MEKIQFLSKISQKLQKFSIISKNYKKNLKFFVKFWKQTTVHCARLSHSRGSMQRDITNPFGASGSQKERIAIQLWHHAYSGNNNSKNSGRRNRIKSNIEKKILTHLSRNFFYHKKISYFLLLLWSRAKKSSIRDCLISKVHFSLEHIHFIRKHVAFVFVNQKKHKVHFF